MRVDADELQALAEEFADQVSLAEDESGNRQKLRDEFLSRLHNLFNELNLLALWGGGNKVYCDMPNNPHQVQGSHKTCTSSSHKRTKYFCDSHRPLDYCPICGQKI